MSSPQGQQPYREISPWVSSPADRRPALAEDLRVDVAIVGGGYTGLSAARSLRAAGIAVAILEQDFAGAGASGRNAGHLHHRRRLQDRSLRLGQPADAGGRSGGLPDDRAGLSRALPRARARSDRELAPTVPLTATSAGAVRLRAP
jgi:glycine/D-amino acid oxidase-like deaminating enzyme